MKNEQSSTQKSSKKHSIPEESVVKRRDRLRTIINEIKEQSKDLSPPQEIITYLRHPIYGIEFAAVVGATYIAILSALLIPANAGPFSLIRIFFGLALVLFLPGWSFSALLFPLHSSDVDLIERISLSFGLSLAISIIDGLLLNELWSLALEPILITLSFITLSMMVLAVFTRTQKEKQKDQEIKDM